MENKKESSAKWLIMSVVIMAIFMVSLDTSIVNISITKMMQTFNASIDQIQWVVSAYTLTLGVVIPSTSYFGDKFGTKNVFITALILFTLGSLLCGISWNESIIIIARVIQGIGGSCIISLGMAILMTTFDKSELGMAIGVMGMCVMAAPALGPSLGGYIIQNFNWRFLFFINLPVGIVAIMMAILIFKKSEHKSSKKFDIIGFLTSSIGMSCVLYVLGKSDLDWNDIKNIVLMIVGCYSLVIFVVNELLIEEPMLDLKLLKNYTFCMSNIIMNVAMLALYGGVFLMPIFLQQIRGLDSMNTGLILFPEAIATAISMVLYGKIGNKFDVRLFAVFALILIGINSYSMSKITLDTPNMTITILLLIRGFGVGFLMAPVQTIGFSGLPKEAMSNASALTNTVKQVGTSIGVTIITSVMQHRNVIDYSNLASQVTSFNRNSMKLYEMLQGMFIKSGMSPDNAQGIALNKMFGEVALQAQLQALNDTMFVISIITVIVIIPTLLLKQGKQEETKVVVVEG
ncbi:DHA2 family efflux MFS transporter permease subunit [Clostridium saccharoperbutylacetonicum]|uniref:DHA2 family efflux MFS transporter permease subunit n=1 Tax=Clostridium saccharoperbutylacetonicum TaxID=36745 RepID=UPI0039E85C7E